jgi:pimeloyl-ACP methyl ester carboxylesterase
MGKSTTVNWQARGCWLRWLLAVLGGLLLIGVWLTAGFFTHLTQVTPPQGAEFHWPYYLYVSDGATRRGESGETVHILVLPNNTLTTDDDFRVHERRTLSTVLLGRVAFGDLKAIILVPIFPRPEQNWRVYTHALDRDVLETDDPELRRLDLQLEAMIDHAADQLSQRGWRVDRQVVMWGFSASGMFTNRFAVLHPERVRAAVVQSPGGWPIAPVETWEGACLRYPIGVCDVHSLVGRDFDLGSYTQVPHLFLLGDRDNNDAVPYSDSYGDEDEALIMRLFGRTPVERWPLAERIYDSVGANAEFRLCPGVGHRPAALRDAAAFLHEAVQTSSDHEDRAEGDRYGRHPTVALRG